MKLREAQVAGIAALLACAGSAMADGVIHFDSTGEQTGIGYRHWGGVFDFTVVSDDPVNHFEGGAGSTFGTFCLESGTDLGHLDDDFRAVVSDSIDGGHAWDEFHSGNNSIYHTTLEAETAFLYSHYRDGTLSTWAYGSGPSDANELANSVQGAMWLFQDQVDQALIDGRPDLGGAYTSGERALIASLYSYAQGEVGAGRWVGHGNVRVLNLFYGNEECQSVLALTGTTVPLPTSAAMAFAGVLGIAGVRRRRN